MIIAFVELFMISQQSCLYNVRIARTMMRQSLLSYIGFEFQTIYFIEAMQRSRTQRSLADQYLDKYFTPGKYSRTKTNQQKSTDKLKKEQKQIQKHQHRSEVQKKQKTSNPKSQSMDVKIEGELERIRSEYGQAKTMELSQQCKKILMKMQRFDRYLYPILSEKQFRQPIDAELKRLERVKNQKKEMWKKTYDTQLLITALFNHIKLVIQMNRELQDRQNFKNQVRELQKKIHQMRNDHKKQLRISGKPVPNENLDLTKEEIVTVKKIIVLLQQQNSQQAQVELKKFVEDFQKVHNDLGRLCELFRNYIFDYKINQAFTKQSSIKKLITYIDSITQSLTLNKVEDLKKTIQSLEKQEIRDHAQQKILVLLSSIVASLDNNEGKLEKNTTKSQAALKVEKKQIQRTNRTQNSKNRDYERQINRLKGQLERTNRELKRVETTNSKQKAKPKKQVDNTSEGQNSTNRDQTIIMLQNEIAMLKKEAARLQQDNRTMSLKIHNLTKHGKDIDKRINISESKSNTPMKQESTTPQKSIKSQKNIQAGQDKQTIEKIIKAMISKEQRDKLLIELKKKGVKNRGYILLDSIIKLQKNIEGKTIKSQQADEITKKHLAALLSLLESQSEQHWWANRNPIPIMNNFKNGVHSVLINRIFEKVKEVYKIWSATQNQNLALKRDNQDYKEQVQIIKIVKQQSTQIRVALKSIEKKFPKVKEDVWEKPAMIKQVIEQQFSKKQLKQLLSVRQDFEFFISFIIEQLRSYIPSRQKIESSRQIKSVSQIKLPQDDVQKTHLDSINAFSQRAMKIVSKGESWQKQMIEFRKSMPRTAFLNFLQSLQKNERSWQLRLQKLQQSEASAKEHLNVVIDLLQSEQSWWKNKNPVVLSYKASTLSSYISKITEHIKLLHQDLDKKQRGDQKQLVNKVSESEQELKTSISHITQTIKNILKKTPNLKNQICSDEKYLINLLKSQIAGKRQNKQLSPLLNQVNALLLEAANIYISNHNIIMDKVEEKTDKLQKQLKDHIKQIQQLQQSLVIKNNKLKKSQHSRQLQNLTFNGEIGKLKNTIKNLLNQQKSNIDRSQSEQKSKSQVQKKFDQTSQQNKNLSRQNERVKKQLQKSHSDLTLLKQKQKEFKTTQRENQKIKIELQTVRSELQSMKQKVKDFYKSKEGLAMNRQNNQIQYQNSISELQMLNKITQEKLQYAEKKKSQLIKEISKKQEQIKFEVDARNKDKLFYDKMKLKLQNQISELSEQLQAQRRESIKTISQLTLEKNQIKKDFDIEQTTSKDKITQLYLQLQKGSTTDRDLLDLRRQLEKAKTELSQDQKNHQIETQELRKYIARMNADMQTLIITKDQEKRVLREQIQLVRQEETNRHFQKMKRVQQQNRSLREEQSRLIYFVQSNQSNFNALVEQNRILYEQIDQYKRQTTDLDSPGRYKESNQKIIALESKLKMFEAMMQGKSDVQDYQKALRTIEEITRDNRSLKDQLRELERRERQSHQLSLSRNNQQSQSFMDTFSKYERLLTENAEIKSNLSISQRELRQLQLQNDRLNRNNDSLTKKIQQKNEQLYSLQRAKNQFDFKAKQSEKILMLTQTTLQREIQQLAQKIKYSHRKNQEADQDVRKIKQMKDRQINNKEQQLSQLRRRVTLITGQKQFTEKRISQLNLQLQQTREQVRKTKVHYQQQHRKISSHIVFPVSNNSNNEESVYKINYLENLINQKEKELQSLKKSEYSLRVVLEQKNLKIQNLMSENYSVRLSLSQKQKVIETNDALSKIERDRIVNDNENFIKASTRVQQQFGRRETQYRQQIDRLRHNCIKYEEELRSLKQNSRRIQFEFEESRKQHHNNHLQSIGGSNVRGYEQNFQKLIIDNNQFRSQIGILELSLKHKEQQIEQLKQKLGEFRSRLNEKVKQIQQKTRINSELNNQIKDVNRQTEIKISMIQFERKNLESLVEDLQREKRNLGNQIDQLRRAAGQKIHVESELQKLRKALFQSQNRISTLSIKVQTLERENSGLLMERQKYSSDYSNPEREIDRMNEQMNSLRRQYNNIRQSLQRKQEQLNSARNQLIQLQFSSKETTQKIKFEKMSIEQELSLLKSKFQTSNSKYMRQKQEMSLKQTQAQRKIQQYQSSNDSQFVHIKKLFEQEKKETIRLRSQIEKLKTKNTELLNLNRQIKEINQDSIRKLHRSVNQKHQLEFSWKANEELVQKVNQKIHELKQENSRLKNGGFINSSNAQRAQSSYQSLLIKIRQLQSRLLHEQDAIYKLQHENRKLNNQKIMLDLQVKRLSRDLQAKSQQIFDLRESTANNLKERYSLSQKVEEFESNNRQQNTQLKTIMSMLKADGYSSHRDDLSEVQILLVISMEIEQLIKNHRRLQMNNKQLLQQRERLRYGGFLGNSSLSGDLAVFGKQLIDSLFDFLFERSVFTSQDVIKMRKRQQSVHFILHQNPAEYFEHLEEMIKDVLQSMIDTQRRYIQVHRNVLKDVKYLLDDFFKSGNNDYLITIKRSLESSLEF